MRKKITIIEDDEAIANMYKFKLESEGYDVNMAHTGPAGLHLLKLRKPHLVLLDLRLPHIDGIEILEHIHDNDWYKDMGVIIAANINRSLAPEKLQRFSFDRYIVKAHHTPAEILEIIREVLNRKTAQSEVA